MSTTCNINLDLSKIQEDLINGVNPLNQIRDNLFSMTAKDVYDCFLKIRDIVETKNVSAEGLKLDPSLLDSTGSAMRYVWKGTNQIAFRERATDTAKIHVANLFGRRQDVEKSASDDSIIQKDTGTAIHDVSQAILEYLIEKDTSGLIHKNSQEPSYGYKIPSALEKFAKDQGLTSEQYGSLYKGVEEIFNQIKDKQSQINQKTRANDKAFILTEQFAFSKTLGTKMDVLFLLSDKRVGVFDYKSMTVKDNKLDEFGNIIEDTWLPPYKQQSYSLQMGNINSVLKKDLGLDVELIRVVPIQLEFQKKPKADQKKGAVLQKGLKSLRIGRDASQFLKQIPIIQEKFESKQLQETLSKLLIEKNNIVVELESTSDFVKKQDLEGKLRKVQKQINDIQVDRDIAAIYDYFKELVERYSDFEKGSYRLKNIDSKTVMDYTDDGVEVPVPNKNYMSLEDMRDLRNSITTLLSIINNTEEFMRELDITDKEKYKQLRQIEAEYIKRASVMLSDLRDRMLQRVLTEDQIVSLQDSYSLGTLAKQFSRASEQDNVLIQEYSRLTSLANDKKRLELQTIKTGLEAVVLPLQQWAKKNGKVGFTMYDMIINKQTGNLISTFTPEFFNYLKEENSKFRSKPTIRKAAKDNILKFYTIKDNAKEIYDTMRDKFIKSHTPTAKELDEWEKKWDIESDYVVFNRISVYYKLDTSKVDEKYLTKEYREIKKPQNKELLDFYNFWEKNMYKFLNDLEVYGENYYSNFIPWIKAEMSEALMTNGMGAAAAEIKESFSLAVGAHHKTDDVLSGDKFVRGKINPETGEEQKVVPRFYLNPIYNNQGQIDTTLKSFNLAHNFLIFAEMALNYKYKSQIEPILETLKDIALMDVAGLIAVDKETKVPGGEVYKLRGVKNEIYEYLDKMIKYNIYGLQYDMDKTSAKFARTLFELDRYNKKRLFGFNLNSAIKAQTASRAMIFFEGVKGIYYTREMMSKATSLQTEAIKDAYSGKENDNLFIHLARFFSPYSENLTPDILAKMSVNKFDSFAGMATEDLINFLGRGDRAIDNMVLASVLQNYGIHEGKLIRLNKESNKGLQVKSLLDSATVKDGKLVIPGIKGKDGKVNLELYNEFRNVTMNVATSIKGTMSPEDINMVGITVMGKLFMSLKTFIPAMAKERFQGISYNKVTKEVTVGRYMSVLQNIYSNMGDTEKEYLESIKDNPDKVSSTVGLSMFMVGNFIKQAYAMSYLTLTYGLANIATLGRASNWNGPFWEKHKEILIADQRSRAIFENYKAKYPNTKAIQEMKYEDFLQYKTQQIRAFAVELAAITSLMIMLAIIKGIDLDDDDKPDYKESKAIRWTYKQLLGVHRELSFFVNPSDWTQNVQTITPIIGLVLTFGKLLGNGFDELRDLAIGENSKQDKTPPFYYMAKMIPYVSTLTSQLELFEQDKKVYR